MKTKRQSECDNETSRKSCSQSRQRRKRTFFTNEQLDRLEDIFQTERFPGITTREELTEELGIKEDRIQVWFQNRRARWRKREIKNKPATSVDNRIPIAAAWPESSIPRYPQTVFPQTFTGLNSAFLPFGRWPYQGKTYEESSVAVAPQSKFTFPDPSTYHLPAIDLPKWPQPPSTEVGSESSSFNSSPSHSPTEPEPSNSFASCKFESDLKRCKFEESACSCEIPSSYLGRRTHSTDEYDAAVGLLSVFERQD